jgi:hypothetical protein
MTAIAAMIRNVRKTRPETSPPFEAISHRTMSTP